MNRPRYHILLIAFVGLLAYSNTFNASFHFDDTQNIVENPLIKNWQYFREPSSARQFEISNLFYSRYIGYLTFALNYHIHGLDVVGYHIVNLAIHIINAVLVYWLLLLTFRTPFFRIPFTPLEAPHSNGASSELNTQGIALFSALLFVSHPIQTQAVTYIVQRFASLATMFYLLSLVFFIQWRLVFLQTQNPELETRRLKPAATRLTLVFWYLSSVISAILAMKTKEIAFTLPIIIMLYEFMFFEGKIKKRILYLIPFLLTMLIIPFTLIGTGKPTGEIIGDVSEVSRLGTPMSRWDYLFTQFRVIVTYIRLLLLPINQNLDYDYPVYHSFFDTEVFLSFLLLSSIFGLGVYLLHRSRLTPSATRLTAFGIFWFFIALSVESSVLPIVDVIYEHRAYLPSVGAFTASTTIVLFGAAKLRSKKPLIERLIVPVSALIIIVLLGATIMRNIVWKDDVALWEDVVSKNPQTAARGHNNLGQAYWNIGLVDLSIYHYLISLRLNPNNANAHNNLAVAYKRKGPMEKAMEHFQIAIRLNPNNAQAHFNLALAYMRIGSLDDARKELELTLQINPYHNKAQQFLNYLANHED